MDDLFNKLSNIIQWEYTKEWQHAANEEYLLFINAQKAISKNYFKEWTRIRILSWQCYGLRNYLLRNSFKHLYAFGKGKVILNNSNIKKCHNGSHKILWNKWAIGIALK
jgi:hypothetical protein